MFTKTDIARIRGLHKASERRRQGLFICEGLKLVRDMLGHFFCDTLILSKTLHNELKPVLDRLTPTYLPLHVKEVPDNFAFGRISSLHTPQPILALFAIPESKPEHLHAQPGLMVMLDNVQDPGNVGTIIRTANWFGVEHLILTPGCADPFSTKVVQASMGALAKVTITKLENTTNFLQRYKGSVYGTFLDGTNIYSEPYLPIPSSALLIMGNEGSGIGQELKPYITHKLFIPPHQDNPATDSLNVGVATAICLSEFRRSSYALG